MCRMPSTAASVDHLHRHARCFNGRCRAFGGYQLKAQLNQLARNIDSTRFVGVLDGEEHLARLRQQGSGAKLAFDIGLAKGLAHAHHLTSGFHLGGVTSLVMPCEASV